MSDHIFQAGDIEEICAGAKKAIDDTKDCISSLKTIASEIQSQCAVGGQARECPGTCLWSRS